MSTPQFVLVLRDNAEGGIEAAGLTEPEQFVGTSPAHIIGRWLSENLDEITQRAALDHKRKQAPAILVEPEKTIISGV